MNRPAVRRATLIFILAAGAALTTLFLWRYRPSLAILAEVAIPLLASGLVALAAFGAGWGALALAHRSAAMATSEPELDETFLIGVSVFGTVAGLVAWLTVAALPTLTVVLAAAGALLLWRCRGGFRWPRAIRPEAALLGPAILFALITAVAPAVAPDELIYKLAVPHAYELYGRMVDLPLNSHSYFVMAHQLADLPALMLGGGTAAHLLHFVIYLASLIAVYRIARRFSGRAAIWVVIVIAYTPALLITAGWAFSEWGALGLLLISFERYQRWMEKARHEDFTIAFAALGAAAAVKYTALPWMAVFGALFVLRARRRPRLLLTAAAITFAFGAFFYVRNAVWTGSPVAPFLLAGAPPVDNYRTGGPLSGWVNFLSGVDILDPRISDEALGVLLPFAMTGVLLARWRDRASRDLLLIGLLQTGILLTMAPVTRNLLNGLVPVAIVGAAAIAQAVLASGSLARAAVAIIVTVVLVAHLVLCVGAIAELVPYLSGRETPAAFLTRTRAFAGVYAWIAETTRPDARFLLIGETRTFYLQRQFVSGGNLDGPRMAAWLARFPTPELMAAGFRRHGITHVLLHPPWYRVASDKNRVGILQRETLLEVSPETDAVLRALVSTHADLRYRDGQYLIFELKQAEGNRR